ncbi:nucleoside-diphosphate-sugar epimerase [Algoriphagus boseongensis]|uniref:Nucleoside-diphosphate-sugar epimerase n=1 Tax=Algoriphagus boseongensis TaxID=1442587 RepID=A0A4R6T521_9BACT|nr:epimerase [Algoriphagus boseongensis]TDQ17423.1 nucleoside-diphosphate-sugar epimerase [Algoriphagus boseongensis]
MTRISIIGFGWLGKPLGKYLKSKGYQVLGSTTSPEKKRTLESEELETIQFSLNPHPEGVGFNKLFQSEILVVNIPPRTRSGNGLFHLEQLKYLRILIDQSPIQKVIFVSSTGIYPEMVSAKEYGEDFPITLENTGNEILFKAEQMMEAEKKFDLTVVRFGGLMGEERIPGKYFSGKENVAGHTRVNFIHKDDAVRMIAWIIEKGLWNQTFNGVAPIHPLRREIYEKNARELGIAPPASFQNEPEGKDRLISAEKILATGFEFEFPDPLGFSYSLT